MTPEMIKLLDLMTPDDRLLMRRLLDASVRKSIEEASMPLAKFWVTLSDEVKKHYSKF